MRDPPGGVKSAWDRAAPWWAAALVVLVGTGLATTAVDLGAFWTSYVLDMTGPAWTYILVRLRYTRRVDTAWSRFFTPTRTVLFCAGGCFAIEAMQARGWYEATADPLDLPAYLSILVPLHLVDRRTEPPAPAGAATPAAP